MDQIESVECINESKSRPEVSPKRGKSPTQASAWATASILRDRLPYSFPTCLFSPHSNINQFPAIDLSLYSSYCVLKGYTLVRFSIHAEGSVKYWIQCGRQREVLSLPTIAHFNSSLITAVKNCSHHFFKPLLALSSHALLSMSKNINKKKASCSAAYLDEPLKIPKAVQNT